MLAGQPLNYTDHSFKHIGKFLPKCSVDHPVYAALAEVPKGDFHVAISSVRGVSRYLERGYVRSNIFTACLFVLCAERRQSPLGLT